ncbi:MAG: hypothetical protein U0T33_01165 [Bacteroidales bacterium]
MRHVIIYHLFKCNPSSRSGYPFLSGNSSMLLITYADEGSGFSEGDHFLPVFFLVV